MGIFAPQKWQGRVLSSTTTIAVADAPFCPYPRLPIQTGTRFTRPMSFEPTVTTDLELSPLKTPFEDALYGRYGLF
jgi:hypothetical protein